MSDVMPSVFMLHVIVISVVGPFVTIVAVTSVFLVNFAYVNETLEPDREASDYTTLLIKGKN
jgi:hypothetical protein